MPEKCNNNQINSREFPWSLGQLLQRPPDPKTYCKTNPKFQININYVILGKILPKQQKHYYTELQGRNFLTWWKTCLKKYESNGKILWRENFTYASWILAHFDIPFLNFIFSHVGPSSVFTVKPWQTRPHVAGMWHPYASSTHFTPHFDTPDNHILDKHLRWKTIDLSHSKYTCLSPTHSTSHPN